MNAARKQLRIETAEARCEALELRSDRMSAQLEAVEDERKRAAEILAWLRAAPVDDEVSK